MRAPKELPEEELGLAAEDNGQEKVGFLETIKLLLQNKYYVRLLFVGIFYNMIMNITSAVGIYYMKKIGFEIPGELFPGIHLMKY